MLVWGFEGEVSMVDHSGVKGIVRLVCVGVGV